MTQLQLCFIYILVIYSVFGIIFVLLFCLFFYLSWALTEIVMLLLLIEYLLTVIVINNSQLHNTAGHLNEAH